MYGPASAIQIWHELVWLQIFLLPITAEPAALWKLQVQERVVDGAFLYGWGPMNLLVRQAKNLLAS